MKACISHKICTLSPFFIIFQKSIDSVPQNEYIIGVSLLVTRLTNVLTKGVIWLNINPNTEKPIFIQIAEQLEDSIFTGVYPEETKIPSTNEISALLNINPHTVLKGMNLLVDEEIVYKKRGLGMFVKEGAVEKIRQKRQGQFYDQFIASLIEEANKLHMTKNEIISMIERGYENEHNSN